ncbi:MAG: SDR family NAD(P)-dependent oxidoreductase [Candidatus Shapirobacteria bacterium]
MKDKVIIITGASQGLGKELSIQLAKLGAKIALVARNEKLLSDVKNIINDEGGVAEVFVCDVTDVEAINTTVSKIMDTFKTVDVLVNNAGVWTNDKLEEKNNKLVEKTFMINSVGPINFYKAVAPIFAKNKSGHFVFINSIAGLELYESKNYAVYSASKWALTGFTSALKSKYDGTDIKVSSIHPGPIKSMIDVNSGDDWGTDESWMMSTAEVAGAVIYALNAPGKIQVETLTFKKTNWNN